MLVTAVIPPDRKGTPRSAVPEQLTGLALAMFQRDRAERHARIERFLAEPAALDAVLPGLASLPPGTGNDRLRALRYGDDKRFGLTKLDVDPLELRAALVAQRIRCWRALRPSEAYAERVCRIGQQAACCRFLCRDEGGWLCAKHTPLADYFTARAEAGQMKARGDNCRGRGAR